MGDAGGSGVRIQTEDFDLSRALEEIKGTSRTIGGVVAFVGVVRDFSQGEEVDRLHFECYPEMAEEQLGELRREAVERFGLTDLSLVHRSGELLPGDNIVLIVAASEHREASFKAAAWCIAELKKRVPIWKKEHTRSGEVWVDGGPSQ
jgi:molybdopterin synthase catalytic subunit